MKSEEAGQWQDSDRFTGGWDLESESKPQGKDAYPLAFSPMPGNGVPDSLHVSKSLGPLSRLASQASLFVKIDVMYSCFA